MRSPWWSNQDTGRIEEFLRGQAPFQIVVEATSCYEWFVSLAEPVADRVVLANPRKLRVIAESTRKTDKLDAQILAEFLALGMIPESHRPSARLRSHRTLVRHRCFLKRRTTSVKNKVHWILARYNADVRDLFSSAGRPKATVDERAFRTTNIFDSAGRTVGTVNALGNRNSLVYNIASQTVAQMNALGNRTTQVFDNAGRGLASVNALGYRNTVVYDAASQVVATVNPLAFRTTSSFDAAGQRRRVTDANGRMNTSLYDAAGQTVATINALTYRTTAVFDAAGKTKALIDPSSGRTTSTYDQTGRRTQIIDQLGRRTTAVFDAAGRQTLRVDPRGNRTTYTFDGNDQQVGRRYADGSRATFTFDPTGNRTIMRDSTGRYTYAYDARSQRSLAVTPAGQRITYSYDALQQRSFMVAPTGGRFTYAFDAAQRITRVVNPEGDRTSYSYDNADRRTVKKLANDTRASFSYDNADRLTTQANIKSTNTYISRYDYGYDNAGTRTRVLEVDGSRVTWLYDATYQLTGENRTGTNAYRDTFTYDPNGNRLLKNANGTRTTTVYDAANQIKYSVAAAGRMTYTFDSAGNQQIVLNPDATRITTTWDYESQPTLYRLADSSRVTCVYNAGNARVQKQSASATTKFVWDEQNYLAETDAADAVQVVYTNEPQQYGNLISQRRLLVPTYFHFDALGSTRQLTNALGNTTDTVSYSAWGETVARTGTTTFNLTWVGGVGYYFDPETGLFHIRSRSYDPSIARWISPDPLEFVTPSTEAFLPIWVSLYRYSESNPLTNTDPSGFRSNAAYLTCRTECEDECYEKYQRHFWRRSLIGYTACIRACDAECQRLADEPKPLLENFYVCKRLVQVQGVARACGCQHTDIYGSRSGEVYSGAFGPVKPNHTGLPKGTGWSCTELKRVGPRMIYPEDPLSRLFFDPVVRWDRYKWGPKKGESCEGASSEDILECFQAKPKPQGDPGIVWNCQTDVRDAAAGCCLTGFVPLAVHVSPILA